MSRKRQDLTGNKYGKLEVLSYAGMGSNAKQRYSQWLCRCDCGNTCVAPGYMLQAGRKKSCGCIHAGPEELIGQRFGMLTVLKEDKANSTTLHKVICQCDCGNTKSIALRSLKSGKVTNCGCVRTGASKKESISLLHDSAKLQQIRKQFVSGDSREIETLYEWIYIWIREILPAVVKKSTLAVYENAMAKHVIPALGEKKLKELTEEDIRLWIEKLRTENISGTIGEKMMESSVCNTLSVLNSCLRDAQKYHLIEKNPCPNRVEVADGQSESSSLLSLTEEQVSRLVPCLYAYRSDEEYPVGIALLLILYTGLSLKEAVALRWKDVDPVRKSLHVQHTAVSVKDERTGRECYQAVPVKGSKNREVPIPELFFQRTMEIKRQFAPAEDAFVANPYRKSPVHPECLRVALARKSDQAGIGRVTPQMLKDTYACRAVQAGASSDQIAELMGFSSTQQVTRRYMPGAPLEKWTLVRWMYDQNTREDKNNEDDRYSLSCTSGNG